jgi:hypothetical protein
MLTHPVTGKPLLLGPAVGAKTSRLGNNSLGTLWAKGAGLELYSNLAQQLSSSQGCRPLAMWDMLLVWICFLSQITPVTSILAWQQTILSLQ